MIGRTPTVSSRNREMSSRRQPTEKPTPVGVWFRLRDRASPFAARGGPGDAAFLRHSPIGGAGTERWPNRVRVGALLRRGVQVATAALREEIGTFRTIAGRSQTATGMPHRPRSKVPAASCVVALLGLGGCATTDGPKPMTSAEEGELVEEIETLADRAGKLNDLVFPILASNVEACGKRVRPSIGASWITEADLGGWPNERRAVAKRHFGVSRRPVLDHVVDGGPAAEAGLRRWDTIVAVDGRHLRSGGGDQSDIAMIVESGADDGRMEITYERGSETASVLVIPVTACDVGVALVEDEQPNAFADGRNVFLTKGLYWGIIYFTPKEMLYFPH